MEGFLPRLTGIGLTVLSMGQTRLAMLGNELETLKLQLIRLLLLAQALLVCLVLGVLLVIALFTLLWWEHRLWVLGISGAAFLLAAAFFYSRLQSAIEGSDPAFQGSLEELKRDLQELKAAASHAKAPD